MGAEDRLCFALAMRGGAAIELDAVLEQQAEIAAGIVLQQGYDGTSALKMMESKGQFDGMLASGPERIFLVGLDLMNLLQQCVVGRSFGGMLLCCMLVRMLFGCVLVCMLLAGGLLRCFLTGFFCCFQADTALQLRSF